MGQEGLYFAAELRDNSGCKDVDYGDMRFRRRSLIAALAHDSATKTAGTRAGRW